MVTLSKTKYIAGLGCPAYLWTQFHAPESVPPFDESTLSRFEQGHIIGGLAKQRYPDGIEIGVLPESQAMTSRLLKQRKPLFEATFVHKNAYCKVDVLVPSENGGWDIVEVKSTTAVEDSHICDVAFQKYTLQGAGVKVNNSYLMHVNNKYVKKGEIDPHKILQCQDISQLVESGISEVEGNIQRILDIIASDQQPTPDWGTECKSPSDCPVCAKGLPEHSVAELFTWKRAHGYIKEGKPLITDLPLKIKLTDLQRIQFEAVRAGKPYIDTDRIRQWLESVAYPVHMLDFETINPAVPIFDGMKPYQQLPFQVSVHVLSKNGRTDHFEYLPESDEDPQPGVVDALGKIGPKGTVFAYNSRFEKGRIAELLCRFPSQKWLGDLIERIGDLATPFQKYWYYHPNQHGSYSIKKVMPVLTGVGYNGMEIGRGDQAAREFLEVFFKGNPKGKNPKQVRKALLDYCGQDTGGMIGILQALEKIAMD